MLYTGRIFQSLNGGSARDQFSNTFEFRTDLGLGSPEMLAFGNAMVSVIASVLLNTVTINRCVISTTPHEEGAANINNFRSIAVNVPGGNAAPQGSTGMYDINHALVIARSGALGRAGAILVRGCLLEEDVQIGSSGEAMLSAAGRQRFDHVPASFGNGLSMAGFEVGLVRNLGDTVGDSADDYAFAVVVQYAAQGVRLVKRNHKYFNRKPKVVPAGA